MVNRANCLYLADKIEALPLGKLGSFFNTNSKLCPSHSFTMETYYDLCGTPACIAGHAAAEEMGVKKFSINSSRRCNYVDVVIQKACKYLGIVEDDSLQHELFYPSKNLDKITPTEAAVALRKVAEIPEDIKDSELLSFEKTIWSHLQP